MAWFSKICGAVEQAEDLSTGLNDSLIIPYVIRDPGSGIQLSLRLLESLLVTSDSLVVSNDQHNYYSIKELMRMIVEEKEYLHFETISNELLIR